MIVEETLREKFLKASPLYPFTKDSVMGTGWEDFWRSPWWMVITAIIFMTLPIIFMIIDKIIVWVT